MNTTCKSSLITVFIISIMSIGKVSGQSVFVELTFTNSSGECAGNDCVVPQVTFNNEQQGSYAFGQKIHIPIEGPIPVDFEISGGMKCGGEQFHCDIFNETGPMPAMNTTHYFAQGHIKLCQEYPLEAPIVSGGNCESSIHLNINTEGNAHKWQASFDNLNWINIANTQSAVLTKQELANIFGDIEKGLFFRCLVIDCSERPSIHPEKIFFFVAPPILNPTPVNPQCSGDPTGFINLSITSQSLSVDDFHVKLYRDIIDENKLVRDHQLIETSFINIIGLPAGSYWLKVENNSDTEQLGDCETQYPSVITLTNPPPVTVELVETKNVSCNGGSDGGIQIIASTSAGGFASYNWGNSAGQGSNPRTNCSPGNYSVILTDNNGCKGADNISLADPPKLEITQITSQHNYSGYEVQCHDKSNGGINVTVAGGTGSKSFNWDDNPNIHSIDRTNLGPGLYKVEAVDAEGCHSDKKQIQLDAPEQIDFTLEDSYTSCPGGSDGYLEVKDFKHIIGQPHFSWTALPETSFSISGKYAGQYTVKVTDDQTCSKTKSAFIKNPLPFTVVIAPTNEIIVENHGSIISCFGKSDGELQAQLYDELGEIADAQSYQWSRNDVDQGVGQIIYGLDAALYKVVAINEDGCEVERTYNLQQPLPISIDISATSNFNGFPISCPGENNGILKAIASGGTPGFVYEWQGGTDTQILAGVKAGEYFVTARDANGCEGTSNYQLNDPPPIVPVINIISNYNGQAITCMGASDANLSASSSGGASPIQFKWSTGTAGISVTNLAAGVYTVEATDANGCKVQSLPVEIIDPDPVAASITVLSDYNGQAIRCFDSADGRLGAGGTGGTHSYSYVWSTNAITADINNLSHGIYSVVVTDQNGCTDSKQIELENPEPVVIVIDTVSSFNGYGVQCHGSQNGFIEVSAMGGTNDFTFDWPTLNQITSRVEDLAEGNYTVTITDSNGCSDDESFELVEPSILTLQELSHNDITCYGGSDGILSVVSTGGFGVHEYSINNDAFQLLPDFAALIAEIPYVVTVKDGNQCLETFETQLNQPAEIGIEFSVEPALCADPVGQASAQLSGGVGNFIYEWKNGNDNIISTYPSITNQFSGIYTLRIRDDHQCLMEKSIGIPSLDGPVGQVVENLQTSCFDSADGYARIDVVSGNGPFTVVWDAGATTWEISDLPRGDHFVSITDVNNCVGIVPLTTLAPEEVTISLLQKTDASCNLSCDAIIEVNTTGGNGEYTFKWNGVNGTHVINNLCVGVYEVEVIDKLGCNSSEVFNVTEPDAVDVRVVKRMLPICNADCNGAIEVVANGGTGDYSYIWSAGSESEIQNNICAGDHTVTVRDARNCTLSRTFNLGEPTKVEIALVKNQSPTCFDGCDGTIEVIGMGGVGGYGFSWPDGSSSAKNAALCSGEHNVTIIDANNCSANAKYSVSNVPQLKIDLGGGVVLCEDQEHELNVGSSWKKIEWTNGGKWFSSSPRIKIVEPGIYSVQVFDAKNCTASDSFVLETSDNLLQASFLMAAEAAVGDTVVFIDVSWPLPDNAVWTFPAELIKILDNDDVIQGKFDAAGEYGITLYATLGQCKDEITKIITILDDDFNNGGGRLGAEEFVKTLTLHPNPNTGEFELEVEFIRESPITISIWNLVNTSLMQKVADQGSNQYRKHFDLNPITSGTYLLRIDFEGGYRTIRFLVY